MADFRRGQRTSEHESATLYWSLAAKMHYIGLTGFAAFFEKHAEEELSHARRIYDYLIKQRQLVSWNIPGVGDLALKTVEDHVTQAYEHEEFISEALCDLYKLAESSGDHATCIFLQWFITEQVEEEDVFSTLLDRVIVAKGKPEALLLIDHELAH